MGYRPLRSADILTSTASELLHKSARAHLYHDGNRSGINIPRTHTTGCQVSAKCSAPRQHDEMIGTVHVCSMVLPVCPDRSHLSRRI